MSTPNLFRIYSAALKGLYTSGNSHFAAPKDIRDITDTLDFCATYYDRTRAKTPYEAGDREKASYYLNHMIPIIERVGLALKNAETHTADISEYRKQHVLREDNTDLPPSVRLIAFDFRKMMQQAHFVSERNLDPNKNFITAEDRIDLTQEETNFIREATARINAHKSESQKERDQKTRSRRKFLIIAGGAVAATTGLMLNHKYNAEADEQELNSDGAYGEFRGNHFSKTGVFHDKLQVGMRRLAKGLKDQGIPPNFVLRVDQHDPLYKRDDPRGTCTNLESTHIWVTHDIINGDKRPLPSETVTENVCNGYAPINQTEKNKKESRYSLEEVSFLNENEFKALSSWLSQHRRKNPKALSFVTLYTGDDPYGSNINHPKALHLNKILNPPDPPYYLMRISGVEKLHPTEVNELAELLPQIARAIKSGNRNSSVELTR